LVENKYKHTRTDWMPAGRQKMYTLELSATHL